MRPQSTAPQSNDAAAAAVGRRRRPRPPCKGQGCRSFAVFPFSRPRGLFLTCFPFPRSTPPIESPPFAPIGTFYCASSPFVDCGGYMQPTARPHTWRWLCAHWRALGASDWGGRRQEAAEQQQQQQQQQQQMGRGKVSAAAACPSCGSALLQPQPPATAAQAQPDTQGAFSWPRGRRLNFLDTSAPRAPTWVDSMALGAARARVV